VEAPPPPRWPCLSCDAKFSYREDLAGHVTRVHGEVELLGPYGWRVALRDRVKKWPNGHRSHAKASNGEAKGKGPSQPRNGSQDLPVAGNDR
jgi:hypothetical protein